MSNFNSLSNRNFVIIGFGGVGNAIAQFLREQTPKAQVLVIDPTVSSDFVTHVLGFSWIKEKIDYSNYQTLLETFLNEGDVLVNTANTCDSRCLSDFCLEKGFYYIDTAWSYWTNTEGKTLKEQDLDIKTHKEENKSRLKSFALVNSGMNPGLISNIALDLINKKKDELSLTDKFSILFTELDTHLGARSNEKHLIPSTWSPQELFNEMVVPAEYFKDSSFFFTTQKAIDTPFKGWTPSQGIYTGRLVPHREVFSCSEAIHPALKAKLHFSGFCYSPPEVSVNAVRNSSHFHSGQIIKSQPTENGFDEIGVLLITDSFWCWQGVPMKRISDDQQKYFNSTLYLVASSAMILLSQAFDENEKGILEAEDLISSEVVDKASKLWGEMHYHQSSDDLKEVIQSIGSIENSN